jgi:ElaB/YqjD/DUF883 family membrane-anchored ribosome-binding protein
MSNRETLGSLAREIPNTIEQAGKVLEQGEKLISETIDKGRHLFSQAVENGEQAVETAYGQARDTLDSAVDSTARMVKKYPLQSLLIGFGVGCLCGLAIKAAR